MVSRRDFVRVAAVAPFAVSDAVSDVAPEEVFGEQRPSQDPAARTVTAQRLSWAGVKLATAATTLFIDPWVTPDIWNGAWNRPVIPVEASTTARFALLTHTHNDHFDPAAYASVFNPRGAIVSHEAIAPAVASRGLRVNAVALWEPRQVGDFTVAPVPAVDGLGEPQVSWVVTVAGRRLIHCGDTLWHGQWWKIAAQYGPFDVAFLPINGAIVNRAPRSGLPASMTPEQAVAAAVVLGAQRLVPIHYGLHRPGEYEEHPDAIAALRTAAQRASVRLDILDEGDTLRW